MNSLGFMGNSENHCWYQMRLTCLLTTAFMLGNKLDF